MLTQKPPEGRSCSSGGPCLQSSELQDPSLVGGSLGSAFGPALVGGAHADCSGLFVKPKSFKR